jgi:hypothetical protein
VGRRRRFLAMPSLSDYMPHNISYYTDGAHNGPLFDDFWIK